MGRLARHQITKPHPSPRFRDTVRLHQFRRNAADDIWCATFKINGHWETRKPVSLATRDFDEACEVARDKFTLAENGEGVASVLRAYKPQEPEAATPAVPEHAFRIYAEVAIAKLRQEAVEADAAVPGKGHNFRTLAHRIENDLLPRWGNVAITAITEHMLNDWIADDFRVEDSDVTVAKYGRQPRNADRKVVWKMPSQTTLGNVDWALLHVWQEAVAAKVVERRKRPIIDKSLGLDGEPRAFIDAEGVQAVANVMTDAWVAAANGHGTDMKRMLRCYVAMIATTGIRAGLEAKRVLIGNVRFLTQQGTPVILIRVVKHQGKHREPRSVIVYEGDPAFDVRRLLMETKAWRISQGATDNDYLFAWADGSFPVFRDALDTLLTAAGALIDPMTKEKRVAYSFRHYFATKLIGLGLSVAQIAEWLGTSSAMVEKHYIQFLIERNAHLLNGGTVRWHHQIAAMAYPPEQWETDRDVALDASASK
jgi:integrase